MIRPALRVDTLSVVDLAVTSGLFPPEAASTVEKLMADYFSRNSAEGHVCVLDTPAAPDSLGTWVADGVAYYQPRPAADSVWELTMIAVRGAGQGRGTGSALLRHVETDLRRRDQRLLLVETSGVPSFTRTRAFYDKHGYQPEARVRDYYEAGDDLVLYRKDPTA